jgi:AcrR family transcriptional regulator
VGGDRRTIATERIYDAATDLIAREGMDAFDIDILATHVHCSRATIYRYAGGKAQIRDAVAARAAARIIETVRQTINNLRGPERVVTAITVALKRVRSDPLLQLMISSIRADEVAWITASPLVAGFSTDLT